MSHFLHFLAKSASFGDFTAFWPAILGHNRHFSVIFRKNHCFFYVFRKKWPFWLFWDRSYKKCFYETGLLVWWPVSLIWDWSPINLYIYSTIFQVFLRCATILQGNKKLYSSVGTIYVQVYGQPVSKKSNRS